MVLCRVNGFRAPCQGLRVSGFCVGGWGLRAFRIEWLSVVGVYGSVLDWRYLLRVLVIRMFFLSILSSTLSVPECGDSGQGSARDMYLRWTPHPVLVTIRNSKDYIRVLLYSCYTTITG